MSLSAGERRVALARLVEEGGAVRATPPLLLPATPFFDLAGEDFGRLLWLTSAGDGTEFCLRPDFTLPIVTQYLAEGPPGRAASYGYLGPLFRQRAIEGRSADEAAEFTQAGLELIGQPDADAALDRVFGFARAALELYGVPNPVVRLGGVGLFEALLAGADMPPAWRPRIRNRFGHTEALYRLLDRLEKPDTSAPRQALSRAALVAEITESMVAGGLSLSDGRTPEEIADRYIEQQALDAAHVPAQTIALLRAYLAVSGEAGPALDAVEDLGRAHGLDFAAPLATIRRHLATLGTSAPVTFDAVFSPRLDYYTGVVFEMTGRDGAVLASGGQYDRLLERLGAKAPIPASGCAVWVDRLEAEAAP